MVDTPRGARVEPVAVVGIGCRLPGDVHSPDEFWDLLCAGRNTTRPLPAERWRQVRDPQPRTRRRAARRRTSRQLPERQASACWPGWSRRRRNCGPSPASARGRRAACA
ncbi:beta-ketoacyl synthase N-terminal-like domain-containing protein [Nonomuraea sp. NPDC052265]|uniref:beta-ketoacyl synthase N-terminal-like domain-containing protein n=1 Tax=Nonomuraea sp. NPDC052265 TaxID=3364374 RepID=UPI0037CA37BA